MFLIRILIENISESFNFVTFVFNSPTRKGIFIAPPRFESSVYHVRENLMTA